MLNASGSEDKDDSEVAPTKLTPEAQIPAGSFEAIVFFSVELAAVDDKSSISNRVHRALLLTCGSS